MQVKKTGMTEFPDIVTNTGNNAMKMPIESRVKYENQPSNVQQSQVQQQSHFQPPPENSSLANLHSEHGLKIFNIF